MKHVRKDKTFIYYYDRQKSGMYIGIRIGRLGAHLIEGQSDNPEKLAVNSPLHAIPLNDDQATPEFVTAQKVLATKELDDMLAGRIGFEEGLL
jgi:hypothetical protein